VKRAPVMRCLCRSARLLCAAMRATIAGVEVEGQPEEIGQLIRAFSEGAPQRARRGRPARVMSTPTSRPARRQPVSPAVAKARKLQGQFMGLTRQLKGADKAKVREVLQAKGKEAAIAEARKLVESGRK
jgi:hypothetical protein